MSRSDLNAIQTQLKVAIQNHQILVGKMKTEPKNSLIQGQLHEIQSEITALSERQKSIVELLRKELVPEQKSPQPQPLNLTQPVKQVNQVTGINQNSYKMKTVPVQALQARPSIVIQSQPATLTNNSIHLRIAPQPPAQLLGKAPAHLVVGTRPAAPVQKVENNTPIRVPLFNMQQPHPKPSILQPNKELIIPEQSNKKESNLSSKDQEENKTPNTTVIHPTVQAASSVKPRRSPPHEFSDAKKLIMERKILSSDEREKQEYMASLNLITNDTLKELQNRRSERKRRSTANPQYSYGNLEPERKRTQQYLSSPPCLPKRGRPAVVAQTMPQNTPSPSPTITKSSSTPVAALTNNHKNEQPQQNDVHDDLCAVCHRPGELLMCDSCSLVYHLNCLEPPLTIVPKGYWSCPQCCVSGNASEQENQRVLALVHSYIAHKSVKEDEKKRLLRKAQELEGDRVQLENMARALKRSIEMKQELAHMISNKNNSIQQSVDKLKTFIKIFQPS